jgi:hypothetical protein
MKPSFISKKKIGFTPPGGNKWKHASGSFFRDVFSQKQTAKQFKSNVVTMVIVIINY